MLRFVILLCSVGITACSSMPENNVNAVPLAEEQFNLNAHQSLKKVLLSEYESWKGTPYQYAGLSKEGVDCSGFVYIIYKQQLGWKIPRTTLGQSKHGHWVAKKDLQIGDMVFFKTSVKGRHVGIYMGKQQFLHASTRKGVIISSLDNIYWSKRYWTARRY